MNLKHFLIIIAVLMKTCRTNKNLNNSNKINLKTVSFQDCGSKYEMLHLSISNCIDVPCKMYLGSHVSFFAEFNDFGQGTNFLKHHVKWNLLSVNSPAIVMPDSCDVEKKCPFQGSVGKAFSAQVYVNPHLPAVHGTIHWEAMNHLGQRVICYKVPISIVW